MVKRMLIDATHPEETRVVVVNGTRLEELDVETSTKRQLKGNIYLAKVVRVEPSLQAAFVDYGGNRHGFLAFSEIHPDYFQIPVADRQALLAAQKAEDVREGNGGGDAHDAADTPAEPAEGAEGEADAEGGVTEVAKPTSVETVGGDEASEQELERRRARLLRNYKIQEVIKRRQIMLVQVVKEERGNKGAALTTYLSLAGRYCVLMPNTARGGGVSRKIINATDRRRLKAIAGELDCPEGMAVIVRTAGSERSKTEIKRDYEYLLRAWDQVRELTLQSTAPSLVYEEASLIKRSIRDLYSRDIDEVLVEGDEGYRLAKDYMRMLTPSHAKKVQPYKDPTMPMFHRYQVEAQLDAMHSPVVQLKSGGYIVINQTEALVAIDVNSGRATKERHIEETAVKTNQEAAEEIARQLRLRDLAGLIVIDFIDMEENRNNHAVERRLKDALKHDRARIQVGKISAFGLLELSRQRLRPSLQETTFTPCPHCAGTGLVRSVESAAVHVLRAIEEEGIRRRSAEVTVTVPTPIALYILNQKRDALAAIEERYQFDVFLAGDDELIPPNFRMDRVKAEGRPEELRPAPISIDAPVAVVEDEAEDEEEGEDEVAETQGDSAEQGERKRRRRRRRKRKPGEGQPSQLDLAVAGSEEGAEAEAAEEDGDDADDQEGEEDGGETRADGEESEADHRKRRRGRRGGRRRRRTREQDQEDAVTSEVVLIPDLVADVFEAAEAAEEAAALAVVPPSVATDEGGDAEPAPEEAPKPRRGRPSRRKAAPAETTPVETAEAAVESAAPAPAEAQTEAETVVAAEEPPKRKRAPRRKAAEPAEATEAGEPESSETKPAKGRAKAAAKPKAKTETKPKAEAKPKATRARKTKADAAAEAAAPVEEPEPAAPVAPPAEDTAPEPTAAAAEDALPPAPPKRGWWNKLLS